MLDKKGRPICGATIKGPMSARNVARWVGNCKRVVKDERDRCWQHASRRRAR